MNLKQKISTLTCAISLLASFSAFAQGQVDFGKPNSSVLPYDGQEIDLLELDNRQHLQALECKWQKQQVKVPLAFSKAYPEAKFMVIHQDNYLEWIAE